MPQNINAETVVALSARLSLESLGIREGEAGSERPSLVWLTTIFDEDIHAKPTGETPPSCLVLWYLNL